MSEAPTSETRAADVARASYGKLVAIMASRTGDIMAAEDALADAFVKALTTWPKTGIPDRPEAWLLTVARNRRTDTERRDARLDFTDEVPDMPDTAPDPDAFPDERLKLLFVCAHPAIDPGVHTPLMLQTVLGLEATDIADVYLASAPAMAQRLVRAKRKIKAAGIPFAIPDPDALATRLTPVLEAIYGAYARDWFAGDGDLSQEALFLASILAQSLPHEPEALGLAALLTFAQARREARLVDGMLVPVPEQDTDLWDQEMIDAAAATLERAAAFHQPGRFQLEAAIQAVHMARSVTGQTNWRALSQLYMGLNRLYPTMGGAVAQAAAVGEDAGPAQGLALLAKLPQADLATFQPFHAVRAHLLAQKGEVQAAAEAYSQAIDLAKDTPTMAWLSARLSKLSEKFS